MPAKSDYYETLGVDRGAGQQQIKSAYRKMAVQYHPDRNPGDKDTEEKFKQAAEAYAVLSDPDKRARYDRFGHEGVAGTGFPGFDATVFSDFSDILGDLFGFGDLFGGGRRSGRRAASGADLRYDLSLSFEEAAFGCEPTLRIPRLETCPGCSGSGSADGAARNPCTTCQGQGQVRYTQGFFTVARTCPQCGGEGSFVVNPCSECKGEGRIEREKSLQITIPAGVDTGARMRLPGEGEHGLRGGPPGDLYVFLRVEEHPSFQRQGTDVLGELELDYAQAVLGTTVEVETLHGPAHLEIPPGTAPGREFRLTGKGIPRLDGRGRGDHLVRVWLRVPNPRQLSEEQLALLKQLAELEGESVREGRKVMDRVRDLFG